MSETIKNVLTETEKIDWPEIIRENFFSAEDDLEKAYKKAKKKTEESGDLLYWLGMYRLKKASQVYCPARIDSNITRAKGYFEKALEEYPEQAKIKKQFVLRIIDTIKTENLFIKEKITELINQGNGLAKI